MAISRPEPRRRLKLPRNLQGGRGLQPYSRADAPYFRSPGFYVRVGGLAIVVAAGLSLLLLRAWSIQVLHGKQYAKAAQHQAFRTVPLLGARGAIVDDRRHLIAGTSGYVVIDADAASLGSRNAHGVWSPSPAGVRALRRLGRLTGRRWGILAARIRSAVLQAPFAPATVVAHPTAALAAYLQERPGLFPGFKVEGEASRSYPRGAFGGEFLGLLGQISKSELKSHAYKDAKPGEVVGQSGVEAAYDSLLNAGFVQAKIPVDSLGRIAGALRVPPQKQPPTLQLSIDTRLQKAAQNALLYGMEQSRLNGSSPTGASAVAIDPWTGAIKAIVSYPTFNQKLAADNPRYLSQLYKETRTVPLLNRAISGAYPTGSTFKPIISEAALSAGIITPSTSLACTGAFALGSTIFHNVEAGINEYMSLPTALEQSCDTWFYRLGDLFGRQSEARDTDPELGAQAWARPRAAGRPNRRDIGLPPGAGPVLREAVRLPVDGGPDDQPRDRPGRPAGEPTPAGRRLLGARQRRHGRTAARGRGRDPERRPAPAPLQARAEAEALAVHLGDQAGAVRGRQQRLRNVRRGVRRIPPDGRRQDGHRRAGPGQLVVRLLGALQPPEARRRRQRRARRLRSPGRRAGR